MSPVLRQFRDFFVSLKLTVWLLALSIILIFWATLAQVHLGVWGVQTKFFRSFFVLEKVGDSGIPLPVFPGGYFIGGLLLINLVAAHVYRFRLEWKKAGIQLTHAGLIVLLLGELLSGLLQVESQMRIEEGATSHYSESSRTVELVVLDTTNPDYDEVVAIPEAALHEGAVIQHPRLPFQVRVRDFYPNAALQMRDQVPNAAPALATAGIGPRVALTPLALTYKEDERNMPASNVELVGPQGPLGIWLVSPMLGMPQKFDYEGKSWQIGLRLKRYYHPFAITLLDFAHDVYPGTDIPKNFSSRIRLKTDDGREDREVLIYMNNPLRYGGLTFYQYQMDSEHASSVLQVVRNPSWLMPYISCVMITLGLVVQFCIHLVGFVTKRRRVPAAA